MHGYEVDQEAWSDFDEWRTTHPIKKARDTWTDLAKKKAAKLLSTLSPEDQRYCVDISIATGWQGIFPDRAKQKENSLPEWARIPKDDNKLMQFAMDNNYTPPRPGETSWQARRRLEEAVENRKKTGTNKDLFH